MGDTVQYAAGIMEEPRGNAFWFYVPLRSSVIAGAPLAFPLLEAPADAA
jgi:hypothetical protein